MIKAWDQYARPLRRRLRRKRPLHTRRGGIQILAQIVDASIVTLIESPPKGHFFGLYGADLILDDALHPWFTEIQYEPGLSYEDPVKAQVVPPMLREAVQIVLEVQRRRRDGQPLNPLDSVNRFEWVYNRA